MTAETAEKLPSKLDRLRHAAELADELPALLLAEAIDELRDEIAGRIDHVDQNTHRVLQQVGTLLDELERFRPLLNMLRPAGTSAPDFISVGQTVRAARKMARSGRDKRS